MELNKVHNIDVLDGLGRLPDGSVNLVLTDPPYNIGKAAWDTIDNYVEWCGKWLKECERLGRQWIGIERDADYCKLAERRIKEARA